MVSYDYRPLGIAVSCPTSAAVGSSTQISATVMGPSSTPLVVTLPIAWSVIPADGRATIDGLGVLHPTVAGQIQVRAHESLVGTSGVCDMTITP